MQTARAYRLAEASLVILFFIGAARTLTAVLLSFVSAALTDGTIGLNFINAHLLLVAAIAINWFAPRPRTSLPATLALTAIIVAAARVPMTLSQPALRLYAALIVFAVGGIYSSTLLRANYRTFLAAVVIAVTLEQVLRANGHTYDISLRESWIFPQIGISLATIVLSRLARGRATQEPYEPANLTLLNGLSFGAFLFLELALLAFPNVIARWADIPYRPVAIWLAFASALSLSPWLRSLAARPLEMFDERTRGWVWILLLALLIVLGNRTGGPFASGALILAQFITLMILWWIPAEADPQQKDQVGPAIAFGMAFFVVLGYIYLLIFEDARIFLPLQGQALTLHLVAVVILGVVLIGWRENDPWHASTSMLHGVPIAFASIVLVGTVIATQPSAILPVQEGATMRVASYNMHYGYSENWRYDLELTARTIDVAQPDIIALQRVDVGRQLSYGVDEVLWLAQRVGMRSVYQATNENLTGIAILSRWPIENEGGSLLASVTEQAGISFAEVRRQPNTPPVGMYSTRLSSGLGERLTQTGSLLGIIGNSETAILAGDMNFAPEDDAYSQLTAGNLNDANAELNLVQDFTYPTSNPIRRLDYIFLRGLTPVDSQKICGPVPASDHCLIVIEILRP